MSWLAIVRIYALGTSLQIELQNMKLIYLQPQPNTESAGCVAQTHAAPQAPRLLPHFRIPSGGTRGT